MATDSILGGLASELSAAAQVDALALIYARLATQATAAKQDTAQTALAGIRTAVEANTLPSGAATEATLAALNTKTPALSSGSVPVTLPSSQITALTPPAAITGFATEATLAARASEATLAGLRADGQAGIVVKRQDADTSPVADGGTHVALTNATGRLKVSVTPAAYSPTVGTITSATSTVVLDVSRASNLSVTITGTFAGVNAIFEVSLDGTNWIQTQAVRTNANTVEGTTGVISAAPAYGWELSVNACAQFRVRATAWTSGTATVTLLPGSFATEPVPAVPTHAVTIAAGSASIGTVTANSFAQAPVAAAGVLTGYLNPAAIALAVVKATSGRLLGYRIHNPNATVAYLQVFNAATTGAVSLGTTTPLEVFPVPATGILDGYVDFSHNYSAGIVIAATTTPTGSTAVGTGLVVGLRFI